MRPIFILVGSPFFDAGAGPQGWLVRDGQAGKRRRIALAVWVRFVRLMAGLPRPPIGNAFSTKLS
jgi:hypothetical protein